MVRRIAFVGGLLLGSALCAGILAGLSAYLFTGKLPCLYTDDEGRLRCKLTDVHVRYRMVGSAEEAGR